MHHLYFWDAVTLCFWLITFIASLLLMMIGPCNLKGKSVLPSRYKRINARGPRKFFTFLNLTIVYSEGYCGNYLAPRGGSVFCDTERRLCTGYSEVSPQDKHALPYLSLSSSESVPWDSIHPRYFSLPLAFYVMFFLMCRQKIGSE